MTNERTKRKPGFDERNSVWITLADGAQWALPKPWLEVRASFREGRAVSTYPAFTYGPDLDELVDAVGECHDNASLIIGAASLGAFLLGRNYDVSDEDLDRLFAVRIGDPSSWDWAHAVIEVATGSGGSRSFHGGSD